MVSKQTLLCQCCRLALPAPPVLLPCPALPVPPGQQLPTPEQGVLGVTDLMEKNTRNFFFPSGREGSVTSGHVQQQGWERDKALGEEKLWAGRHSIAQRM